MRTMTFGGLTVGDGLDICFGRDDVVTGLDDLPEPRSGNVPRAFADGAITGPLTFSERVVTVSLTLLDAPGLPDRIADLMAATVGRSESALTWDFGHGARSIRARCHRRSIPSAFEANRGVARAVLQFVATDPHIYGTDEHSGTTGPGTRVGGLGFPTGFPLGFGDVTSNSFETINNGSAPAPWTGVLQGPLSSPIIELVSTGDRLSWDGLEIADGQSLVLSSADRTARLGGTSPRPPGPRRDWFSIPPGSDNVRLSASSGTGSLVMRWYDTWL